MREEQLRAMNIKELRVEAKAAGVKNYANFKKEDYIQNILAAEEATEELVLTLDLDNLPKSKAQPKKEPKKVETEDIITPADLAEEFGFRPQKVRRILRNAGYSKKDGKRIIWSKDDKELEAVRNLLTEFTQKEEAK